MDERSRRQLLAQAALLAGAALTPASWTNAAAQTRIAEDPFTLGVASGEPTADGVVLWTRLGPKPLQPDFGLDGRPVKVGWVIGEDEAMQRIAARGTATAAAEGGYAVHVEVQGLRPDRWYWYRFTAGGHESPLGRTRTTPARGAGVTALRIGYGSCQKYEAGNWAAHRQLAADTPDLILFLGDYIYEGATGAGVRKHPPFRAEDLGSYRHRYALYKLDPHLQASHAAAPWMTIWDDHEVSNDYGDDMDRTGADRATFLKRRAAGYQAFYENMPLRRRTRPVGPDMQLYRSLDWGRLAQLQFLDGRQHRNHRTCEAVSNEKSIPYDCAERQDPQRSLLGMPQERWLHDRLTGSRAGWNLLAQQYLMGELRLDDGRVSNDGWDGYPQTRQRILETWRDAKVANPVVLGGDIHCFFAGDLELEGRPVASEFIGGSISSLGRDNAALGRRRATNPHLKYAEGERRGFGMVELTPEACTVTFRGVQNAFDAASPVSDLAKFVVEAGQPGLKRA